MGAQNQVEAIRFFEGDGSTFGRGGDVFIPKFGRQPAPRKRLWSLWLMCPKPERLQ